MRGISGDDCACREIDAFKQRWRADDATQKAPILPGRSFDGTTNLGVNLTVMQAYALAQGCCLCGMGLLQLRRD